MVVSFGILFHANSPFSWSFEPAFHYAYKPVVELIEKLSLNINWHVSAPLLQMINWKYPEIIDKILQGIEEGKYEVLSSSYAQNVMYATSDWSNNYHLNKNKEIVNEIFNLTPVGFWNPERVWTDRLAEWLVDRDYFYTLVETQILNSKNPEVACNVYSKKVKGQSFYFLPDNKEIQKRFDHAIWTGENEKIIEYLKYLDENYDNSVVCYAQDTENFGYWQLSEDGLGSREVHKNLENLLRELKNLSFVKIDKFSDIIANNQPILIDSLPDGQATWMIDSAKRDGYKDYIDYLQNAPEIKYYNELFMEIENRIKKYEEKYNEHLLFDEALMVYLSHQFEFGCATGSLGTDKTRFLSNVPGSMLLEGVRLTNYILDALDEPIYQFKWKNLGNHPVIVFSNENIYSMWSPYGGRCVLLIDKIKKTIISPNPFFYNVGNSIADLELPNPIFEFPEIGSSIIHGGTLLVDMILIDNCPIGITATTKRIFSKHGYHDEVGPSLSHNYFDTQIIPFENLIKFWIKIDSFILLKEITFLGSEIRVKYTIKSENGSSNNLKLIVSNEVSPTPNDIMIGGTNILDIKLGTTDYSIMNVDSGAGISIIPSIIPSNTDVMEVIFGKRLSLHFSHKLSTNHPFQFDLKVSLL